MSMPSIQATKKPPEKALGLLPKLQNSHGYEQSEPRVKRNNSESELQIFHIMGIADKYYIVKHIKEEMELLKKEQSIVEKDRAGTQIKY